MSSASVIKRNLIAKEFPLASLRGLIQRGRIWSLEQAGGVLG